MIIYSNIVIVLPFIRRLVKVIDITVFKLLDLKY